MAKKIKKPLKLIPSREMILLNTDSLREKVLKRIQDLRVNLEAQQTLLEKFESQCTKAFMIWKTKHFGELTNKIAQLEVQIVKKEEVLSFVWQNAAMLGRDERESYEAYQSVSSKFDAYSDLARDPDADPEDVAAAKKVFEETRDEFDENQLKARFEAEYGDEKYWNKKNKNKKQTYQQAYQKFKDNLKAQEELRERLIKEDNEDFENEEEDFFSFFNFKNIKNEEENKEEETSIKEIYHFFAKKLHPDFNQNLTQKEIELWHEVHSAYQRKDLHQLKDLKSLYCVYQNNLDDVPGLFALEEIKRAVEIKLSKIGHQLSDAKKNPAWNFSHKLTKPKLLNTLSTRLSKEFDKKIQRLSQRMEDLEMEIERIK